ncbi:MAG TPA: aspartate ammonia-lyase [Phycisphaerae bacterium]|nr:aspartate ammonia-lyase [Phycisphaerae bacterium]HNU46246.1 aspartate ammonia-lyase [Phycisphaerae bacterium]
MPDYRVEHDLLGERRIPADALYGVHTARALENFPLSLRPVHPALIHAYGAVKLACARTNHELGWWDEAVAQAIEAACTEMMEGKLDAHVRVDALQGGAGTSTNMNVNEVLANRALQLLGRQPGEYDIIGPHTHLNLHQSTNDTYPTALKVAAIHQLHDLEREVVALQEAFQGQEKALAHIVKVGRTQLQDAVLVTLGREMSAYAEALSRDRWRIYKCEERLRVVNLGGTAIGTGLGAPRQYIFRVVEHLRTITNLGLARAENLIDATANNDVFVEVSGILKACAVNLLKIATDLRLLGSGPDAGFGEIVLPARQAGSSIMPGKVNPVIPEAVAQAAMMVIAHDLAITQACAAGNLELNAFLPLVADALLTSVDLLTRAGDILRRLCVTDLHADEGRCRAHVSGATTTVTALIERIGYEAAERVAQQARREGKSIRELVVEQSLLQAEEFDALISPEAVTRLGSAGQSRP